MEEKHLQVHSRSRQTHVLAAASMGSHLTSKLENKRVCAKHLGAWSNKLTGRDPERVSFCQTRPLVSCRAHIQEEKVAVSSRNTFDNSQVRTDVKP